MEGIASGRGDGGGVAMVVESREESTVWHIRENSGSGLDKVFF